MDFSTVLRFFKEHDRKKFESIIPKGTGYNVAHIPHEILTKGQKNEHLNTARLEDFFTTATRIQASVTDPVFRTLMEGCVHYICDGSHETGMKHPHHFCEEYTRRVREYDERPPLRPVGMGAPAVPPPPASSAPSAAPSAQVPPPAPAPSAEEAQLRKQVTEAVAENVRLREQMARADEIARQSIAEAHGNLKASEQKLHGTEEELRKTQASLQAEQERAEQRENLLRDETVALLQQIEAQKLKCVELERISQEKILRMEGTIATLTQQQLQKDEDSKKQIEDLTAQFSVALGEQKTALKANLAAEREKADQKAQASRAQIESMREEINAERMRFEELSGISTTLTQRLQNAKVRVASLEEQCRAQNVTIEEKVAHNKELNERLAQAISTSDKKIKVADRRAASMQEHFNKIEREYLEMKASKEALTKLLLKAKDELSLAHMQTKTLIGQYASLERMHTSQIRDLESQLLVAQQREEAAEKRARESQAHENGMKEVHLAAQERASQEKATLQTKISELQNSFKIQTDELSQAISSAQQKQAKVERLENQLRTEEETQVRLRSTIQEAEQRAALGFTQAEQALKALESIRDELLTEKQEEVKLADQRLECEARIATLQEQLSLSQIREKEAREEAQKSQDHESKMGQTLLVAAQEKIALEAQIAIFHADHAEIRKSIDTKQDRITILERSLRIAQAEVEALAQRTRQLESLKAKVDCDMQQVREREQDLKTFEMLTQVGQGALLG